MTMVSELVLTRNQLLEIMRHTQDSEFKAPLQRLSNVTAELQEGVIKTRMQADRQRLVEAAAHRVRDLSKDLKKTDRARNARRRGPSSTARFSK